MPAFSAKRLPLACFMACEAKAKRWLGHALLSTSQLHMALQWTALTDFQAGSAAALKSTWECEFVRPFNREPDHSAADLLILASHLQWGASPWRHTPFRYLVL